MSCFELIHEFTLFPLLEHVALRGVATQSSLFGHGFALNAIDGNREANYHHGSCTHTAKQISPWWRLDLLQNHEVFSVTITNRGDQSPERLNGAEIRIGTRLDNDGIGEKR